MSDLGKLVWHKDKESGSYISETGRWFIFRDRGKWKLNDNVSKVSYTFTSLKACQAQAMGILMNRDDK